MERTSGGRRHEVGLHAHDNEGGPRVTRRLRDGRRPAATRGDAHRTVRRHRHRSARSGTSRGAGSCSASPAATGLLMAFVVFRIQSLVDSDVDPYYFGKMGRSLAEGHGFAGYGTLLTRRVPLYPMVIGAIYWAFGEHTNLDLPPPRAVLRRLVRAGLRPRAAALQPAHGRDRRSDLRLHPVLLRYLPSLHLETQLTFLIMLLLWLMVRFYERPTWQRGALIGVVAGAASLTKAVAIGYPFLFVVGMVLVCIAAPPAGRGPTRRRGSPSSPSWWPSA